MIINEAECEAAGISVAQIRSIGHRIERAAKEANTIGVQIFGGSCGSLRFDTGINDKNGSSTIILATGIGGNWSGGDGAEHIGADGLMKGE